MTQRLNDYQNDDDGDDDDDDNTKIIIIIINTLPILWLRDPLFINCNTHENPRGGSEYCLFDRNSFCL